MYCWQLQLQKKKGKILNVQCEIIHKDWYKRRPADINTNKPVSATVTDFEFTHNHFCTLIVTYEDKTTKSLLARVLYNSIKDSWAVDGMEVAVKIINAED